MNILFEIKPKEMNRYQWIMVDKKNPKNIIATGKKRFRTKTDCKKEIIRIIKHAEQATIKP